MLLKAGLLSFALLLTSRLLGLLRESGQAAVFGATGEGDAVVLMLSLPDMVAGVLAGGALAYVLLPHWARKDPAHIANTQHVVARWLVTAGVVVGGLVALLSPALVHWLAAGVPPEAQPLAARGLLWAAPAIPAALLAALWVTRLQHERDVGGMYAANLVVNGILVAGLMFVAGAPWAGEATDLMGIALLAAVFARLVWLAVRLAGARRERVEFSHQGVAAATTSLPASSVWAWAAMTAGVAVAMPFVARSMASQGGEGALATFNYAWKLVELPLLLAIQLAAALAFPAIASALAPATEGPGAATTPEAVDEPPDPVRGAFAVAWTLACAAAAGLLWGAPALAQLLFGWGRMDAQALMSVARWGGIGAWGLLPQALIAVAVTVLAAQRRLHIAALVQVTGLMVLLGAAGAGIHDGAALMWLLNGLFAFAALALMIAIGFRMRGWIPVAAVVAAALVLAGLELARSMLARPLEALGTAALLGVAAAAAVIVVATAWAASGDLRRALRR